MKLVALLSNLFHAQRRPRSSEIGAALASRFTLSSSKPLPLDPKEQDELDALLHAAMPGDGLDGVTALDGFLTCLVVGPDIAPEEWLDFLFHGQPPFEDDARTARLLALIERRYRHIAFDFARPKPRYQPLFAGFSAAKTAPPLGRKVGSVYVWCIGFMAGTDLRSRAWDRLLDTRDSYSPLYMPWLLGTPEGSEKRRDDALEWYLDEGFNEEEAEQMVLRWYGLPGTKRNTVSSLKKAMMALYVHWHSRMHLL